MAGFDSSAHRFARNHETNEMVNPQIFASGGSSHFSGTANMIEQMALFTDVKMGGSR